MKRRHLQSLISRRVSRKASSGKNSIRRVLQVQTMETRNMLAAETLRITIENLSDENGLAQTPFWIAAHDGTFQTAALGQPAANFTGLEQLAEEGDTSGIAARFASDSNGHDAVIAAPSGFPGAPVFEPYEIAVAPLFLSDTTTERYFSYASMVIPSNDAFIANLDPMAIELFDATGQFTGARSIVIYGSDVYDAGTEVNDASGGAAFSTLGGTGVDEGGVVMHHSGLDEFVGTGLPTGDDLGRAFAPQTPIARITIALDSDPQSPFDHSGPKVRFHADQLKTMSTHHAIQVTYSDPSGVDLTSIDPSDIRVIGPLLTTLNVDSVTTDALPGTTPHEVTATYHLSTHDGSFDPLDNGTYSVALLGNQVNDPFGHSASPMHLGEFGVDIPMRLNVSFENLSDSDGLFNTPVWVGTHDGNFRVGLSGVAASNFAGLEAVAEEGDVSGLRNRFASQSNGVDGVLFAPDGFPGAPIFEPGETVSESLEIANPLRQRFFSYASMIIPSNDAFIANFDPRGIELFDAFGQFRGTQTFTVYGRDIWDAGTEVNDPAGGAAFSTGGGTAVDEGGVIHRHVGLDDFVGGGLATGEDLGFAFDSLTPIGRFTISMEGHPATPQDHTGPMATLDASDLLTSGQSTHHVQVVYTDPSGIDVSSIDVDDLHLLGTGADNLEVVGVTTDAVQGQNNHRVVATYEIASKLGDTVTPRDNGLYFVSVRDGEVADSISNTSDANSLGSFEVYLPVSLEITLENLLPSGGLSQTPFWIGVHDGGFKVATAGQAAADFGGLEMIAEEGDPTMLSLRFQDETQGMETVVTAPDGFPGAPILEPNEVTTGMLDVFNTNQNRFLSYASMVIPSNDAFVANLNSRAIELFDAQGFFRGPQTITVYGRDIWDAGTEVNDPAGGAAFTVAGGSSVDESGVIHRHSGLADFIGAELPTGGTLMSAFNASTPIARLTIGMAGSTQVPVDHQGPTAEAMASDVTLAGTDTHEVHVTYRDPSGIDLSTIDPHDIMVVGPLNHSLEVVDAMIDPAAASGDTSVSVVYRVKPMDGPFTARDNGNYFVTVRSGEVSDTFGQATQATSVGDFAVDVGVRLQISIESLTESNGLYLSPFWVGLHEGGFELARGGMPASQFAGIEMLAEQGNSGVLSDRFMDESDGVETVVTAPAGFPGLPVFDPGEVASQVIEVRQSYMNRFLCFASMVVPSNDAFVANRNPRQYELFDPQGNFHGARQITLYGRDVLDSGTEVNDPDGGAAFTLSGGMSVDENGVIHTHDGLDEFIGADLPTGNALGTAFTSQSPIVRITISLFDPEADVCTGVLSACSVRSVSLQNAALKADVNRDGKVSPLDALLIINFLGRSGRTDTIADEAQATGLALDVAGDEVISPMDALTVINELARLLSSNSAQGEAIDSVFADPEFGSGLLSEDKSDDDIELELESSLF
ncbi:spondin domain-containing protein [Rhodopirellula sp. MGV]|uniref:spondin domain-containing protein n=1 Tax=Rhodopirellula sp. MGV TaxID=2023130 RepID=UPI000B977490|nr:spondin domain-containing protein [Rhodopirellula sp. MGV]OYP34186.1 hypothetical protein CGZ80_16165 [Rhodopirellula sp. MGV]PNY33621.1 hypothetical protein C2E31_27895 [Rhodopirellula baltica]